jgi:putative Mg2+ transporter-C (MgtC) family protein
MNEKEFALRLGLALLLGTVIGAERQWRQRTAGLRTNALVSAGAALFVLVAAQFPTVTGLPQVAGQIVTGIGFLGAGVILREGFSIRGLNTAATLWCVAAIGTLAGAGLKFGAVAGTVVVLSIHVFLRPLARLINLQPRDTADIETIYRFRLVCRSDDESRIRSLLLHMVNGLPLMLHSLHSEDMEDPAKVEVTAGLVSSERNDALMEQLVSRLSLESGVSAVSWEITSEGSR